MQDSGFSEFFEFKLIINLSININCFKLSTMNYFNFLLILHCWNVENDKTKRRKKKRKLRISGNHSVTYWLTFVILGSCTYISFFMILLYYLLPNYCHWLGYVFVLNKIICLLGKHQLSIVLLLRTKFLILINGWRQLFILYFKISSINYFKIIILQKPKKNIWASS